jgi:hypothetical protein
VSVDDLRIWSARAALDHSSSDPEFELILPKGYGETFRQQTAALPDEKRVLFRYHGAAK